VDKKFLQDKAVMTYAWLITVTNLKAGAERVTVQDQVPVSRVDSVKIRKGEMTPKPTNESDLGELEWEVVLEPGEKREIRFSFTIEAPRDLNLMGLPPLRE
jgi:hypothetical protein